MLLLAIRRHGAGSFGYFAIESGVYVGVVFIGPRHDPRPWSNIQSSTHGTVNPPVALSQIYLAHKAGTL